LGFSQWIWDKTTWQTIDWLEIIQSLTNGVACSSAICGPKIISDSRLTEVVEGITFFGMLLR